MPTFVHPALLWGLLAVGVPVLIHLINMFRHRRVRWAAMEFLLVSQRRNRTWVLLRQLLLLAARMAAVAILVALLAQPMLRGVWGDLLGAARTHHVVLLDDSFSMSDRWADTSAFAEAKEVVRRIAATADGRQRQRFTLLRFSQALRPVVGTQADFVEEPLEAGFRERLESHLSEMEVSQTAAGPARALQAVGQLLGTGEEENRLVYLVSDFRAREWDEPVELREDLARLADAGALLHLVPCVDDVRANLAIRRLAPADGLRAAGVPFFMELTVENFAPEAVHDVTVMLTENGHSRPAVTIESIPPRATVTERFQVRFSEPGTHLVTASLEGDAVAADNHRFAVVDVPADVPVLLVDGAFDGRDARYLAAALAPGGRVRTGVRVQVEPPRFLALHPLDEFAAVFLANVEHLEDSAVAALEGFAAGGGGVVFFLGERSGIPFHNEHLYRDGEGIFPAPLAGPEALPVDRLRRGPDLQVAEHPIFRIFQGERNTFLELVNVERYVAVPADWRPTADSTARTIARLRNGAPLVVERRFGEGHVLAFLTTAAPVWNNWARGNPSFVIAVQEMQAFFSRGRDEERFHPVGVPIELELDPAVHRPEVRFVVPGHSAPTATLDAVPTDEGSLRATVPETFAAGFYEARLLRADGGTESRRLAVNVEPAEGDLALLTGPELAARLEGIPYQYSPAAALRFRTDDLAGRDLSTAVLALLVVLLVGEQVLAYSSGYHLPARTSARGGAA